VTSRCSSVSPIRRGGGSFDNAELRRVMGLTLDRKAFVDIITQGKGDIAGFMLPGPEGIWGMPSEMLQTLSGYGNDVDKNHAEARQIMQKLGYGPDHKLAVTVSTRNVPAYRDPAMILVSQLNEIYMEATLDPVDTVNWYPKVMRKGYTIGLNVTDSARDDPDQQFYESYVCGADRNYAGYCKSGGRQAGGTAVVRPEFRQAQDAGLGNREAAGRGRRPLGHLLLARRDLPVSASQRTDHYGQQPLQRLALRRRLARQIGVSG
jgi:ABC-type transport system substrate-binding protein